MSTDPLLQERLDILKNGLTPLSPNQPNQPNEPLGSTSTVDLLMQLNPWATGQQQGINITPQPTGAGGEIRKLAGGAIRGMAAALQPLQLPQDVMFAVVAGAEDPNTTIAERLKKVQWLDYIPFGKAPARPATGQEIFQLMGLHGAAAKWAGIGADLIADPLIFGSYLRIAGKLADLTDLVKLGDKFDTMISPLGMGRNFSKPVMAAVKRSSHLSDFVDSRMHAMASVLRNPDSTMFGIERFGAKAAKAVGVFMPRDAVLRMRFGAETGNAIFGVESMSNVAGRRLSTSTLEQLALAQHGAFGMDGKEFIQKYTDALSSVRGAFEKNVAGMPQLLRDAIESNAYHIANNVGFLHLFTSAKEVVDPALKNFFNEAVNATSTVREGMPWQKQATEGRALIDIAHEKVLTALKASPIDMKPGEAIGRFDSYLKSVVQIDAKLGYITSGLDFVRDTMRSRVFGLTGSQEDSQGFWMGLLGAGITGDFQKYLDSASPFRAADLARPTLEEAQRNAVRRGAYMQQLSSEMESLGFTSTGFNQKTFDTGVDHLTKQAQNLHGQLQDIKGAQKLEQAPLWEQLQGAVDHYKQTIADVIDTSTVVKRSAATVSKGVFPSGLDELRQTLAKKRIAGQQVGAGIHRLEATLQEGIRTRSGPVDELQKTYDQLNQMFSDLTAQQFVRPAAELTLEEAQKARATAMQAAGDKGPPPPIPTIHGKNATIDDMVAMRLLRGVSYDDAINKPFTYGEILDGTANMGALKVGAYLKNIASGHLRRAYGVFQGENGFIRYIDSMRKGKIISNNILDELNLKDYLPNNPRAVELIDQYRQIMASKSQGLILRQAALIKHMVDNGMKPAEAKGAIFDLIRGMNDHSPEFKQYMDELKALSKDYVEMAGNYRGGSHITFAAARKEIPRQMLEKLGEYSNASISVFEGTENARRVVDKQQYLQQVYKLALRHGLVATAAKTDEFGAVYRQYKVGGTLLGPFQDKYVHPQLQTEIRRALEAPGNSYGPLQRIRSLIMGGYLASPNVLAANFMGNLYQVALLGVHPVSIVKSLMGTYRDVMKSAAGNDSEMISTLKKLTPLELTGMEYQDVRHAFDRVRWADMGMGPDGVGKVFDQLTTAYERFLRRPGFGPVRFKYAGLEGFQFIENWFKVAAFKHMRETLRGAERASLTPEVLASIDRRAAEFSRVAVFDYSTLPESLRTLKNMGLVLFPGFPYFMAGRTASAFLKNPGGLAVADRISEAVTNSVLPIQDQYTLYYGMPNWLKSDQGVPIIVRQGRDGNRQVATIPLAQIIPTTTVWDGPFGNSNPWAQSIAEVGLWGPLFEIMLALSGFTPEAGQAVLSGRFGNRVFDPEARGLEKAAQVFRFAYNTMAPSVVKKLIEPNYNNGWRGLFPDAYKVLLPNDLAQKLYSFNEIQSRTPDRNLKDSVIATFLRSPREIALSGPLSGVRKQLTVQRAILNKQLASIKKKMERAAYNGDQGAMEHYRKQYEERVQEFSKVWLTYLDYYQKVQSAKRAPVTP